MGSREFSYWQAFNSIEPIDGRRGDMHAAMIATEVHNSVPRESYRQYREFIEDWWKEPEEETQPTEADQLMLKQKILAGFGAVPA